MRLHALSRLTLLCAAAVSASFLGMRAQSAPPAAAQAAHSAAQRGAATGKLLLAPHYVAGQVERYQLETTTTTESHRGGAVRDPQGSGKLTLTWSAISRMEVLSAERNAQGQPNGKVRLRSTYEKSAAKAESATYDPEAVALEAQYNGLAGKSFEFTLDATGKVSDIKGIEGLGKNAEGNEAESLRAWLAQFSASSNGPRGGVVVGQTWVTDQPVPAAPLAGLAWHSRSTYLRDDLCQIANSDGAANAMAGETCAVILTKLVLGGARPGRDATPESYRSQGLRTRGTWTGEGSSLIYISLSTGRIVSATQSSTEHMDFTVSTPQGETRMAYQGAVESRSQLALLPPAPPKQ